MTLRAVLYNPYLFSTRCLSILRGFSLFCTFFTGERISWRRSIAFDITARCFSPSSLLQRWLYIRIDFAYSYRTCAFEGSCLLPLCDMWASMSATQESSDFLYLMAGARPIHPVQVVSSTSVTLVSTVESSPTTTVHEREPIINHFPHLSLSQGRKYIVCSYRSEQPCDDHRMYPIYIYPSLDIPHSFSTVLFSVLSAGKGTCMSVCVLCQRHTYSTCIS